MVSEEPNAGGKDALTVREFASWLVRAGARTEIYVPADLGFTVTMDEFSDTLAALCQANRLPTKVTRRTIHWDDTTVTQSRILVEHRDSRLNAATLIVGLDQIGSFYYVEEKLCWDLPSDLPAVPSKRVTNRPSDPGGLQQVIRFGPFWLRERQEQYKRDLADWEATRSFDEAINAWLKRIAELDHRSRTDDELGRFYLAVKSTIRQAIQQLFTDRHAELRERKEREMSRQELEAELEKRKTEGFK